MLLRKSSNNTSPYATVVHSRCVSCQKWYLKSCPREFLDPFTNCSYQYRQIIKQGRFDRCTKCTLQVEVVRLPVKRKLVFEDEEK